MILYRETTSRGGCPLPAWLEGDCPGICHRRTERGTLVAVCDPILLSAPAESSWHEVGDGWQAASTPGPLAHDSYLRRRRDLERAEVEDGHGRVWRAPVILTKDGHWALPVPWGRSESGAYERRPRPDQAPLIAAAEAARVEILEGRLAELPAAVAIEWACALIEATYHISGPVMLALGLLDDDLIAGLLFAATGWPKPLRGVVA